MTEISFKNKTVIVTGSTTGIGEAIAKSFGKAGANVIVHGRDEKRANDVVGAIVSAGGVATAVIGDITLKEVQKKLVDTAVEKYGGLDVLVNNCGKFAMAPVAYADEKAFDDLVNLNVKSVFFLCQYAYPHLAKTKGNIVNISSSLAHLPIDNASIYNMTKAAIISLTKTWALEWARSGVRVNCVSGGACLTEATRPMPQKFFDLIGEAHPLGRIGMPQDLSNVVLFLASDMASFLTGSDITADAGNTLRNPLCPVFAQVFGGGQ